MFELRVADWNSQAIEAELDEVLFYLVLDWNSTSRSWTLGIRNAAYDLLISGIALVPNYPLTWQFRYPAMPAGELYAFSSPARSTVGGDAAPFRSGPIPRDGFSSGRYRLVYETEQDLIDRGVLAYWGRTSGIVSESWRAVR